MTDAGRDIGAGESVPGRRGEHGFGEGALAGGVRGGGLLGEGVGDGHALSGGSAGASVGRLAPLLPGGQPVESLLRSAQFFTPGEASSDYREVHRRGGRGAEEFYRERWRHDREVRSTHGVNCTGSCSWKVYVKDGIITWETQQTDYPSVGPDSPECEPASPTELPPRL